VNDALRLVFWELTARCNLSCRHCRAEAQDHFVKGELSTEEILRVAADIREAGDPILILTGGEPTIAPLLLPAVRFAHQHKLFIRMITNGQRISELEFLRELVESGLTHLHLSLHSSREVVHDFLTQTPGSHQHIDHALANVATLGITADINTVINAYNSDHLDETVRWIVDRHPHVRHFVWNNMDPNMNRAERNPDVIPRLGEFELSLNRAMRFLTQTGRTFRAERVPLCYMPEYADSSTETRKIVKEEERCIRFLDKKGFVLQKQFLHGKAPACDACALDPVCAGLYSMGYHYDPAELFPIVGDPISIMRAVLRREPEPALVKRVLARRAQRSDEQPDDHGLRAKGGSSIAATPASESARVVHGIRG